MKMQTLLLQTPAHIGKRDACLETLRNLALDPTEIGWKDDGSPAATLALETILAWVRRWQAADGNRERLVQTGCLVPPVHPGCDPEQDWYCFARWMRREPLSWTYEETHGALPEADSLTDHQIAALLDEIEARLGARGVSVDLADTMPEREIYRWLREDLRAHTIEFLSPQTHLVIDGCDGDCAGCFQRRWCPLAMEYEAGEA